MSEASSPQNLFAEITAKPGMGALFVRCVGPSIGAREAPIIQDMVSGAIDSFGPTLKHVILDLSTVTYMNSAGLGMLVSCRLRALTINEASTILLGPHDDIQDVLKLVKFDRLFTIVRDADELAKAMGR